MHRAIFLTAFATVVIHISVWVRLHTNLVSKINCQRIHPQAVATSAQPAAKLTDSRAADNFRNLFELPVLFYLALTVAAVSGLVTTTTLVLAWLFVLLRVAHSAIQCSYNKVMHRFQVYFAGGVVLWLLWAWLAWLLFLR